MVEVSKPRRRPSIVNPETGESGKYRRVQGRHVFEPSAEQEASEIGDKELERWEHPSPSFKESDEKDKNTYGYGRPNDGSDPRPDETYRGTRGDAIESETYIGTGSKTDMDKLADTKLGDKIKYFDNGIAGDGTVVKISGSYITLLNDIQDVLPVSFSCLLRNTVFLADPRPSSSFLLDNTPINELFPASTFPAIAILIQEQSSSSLRL